MVKKVNRENITPSHIPICTTYVNRNLDRRPRALFRTLATESHIFIIIHPCQNMV